MCETPCAKAVLKPKATPPENLPCFFVRYFLAESEISLKPEIEKGSLDHVSAKMMRSWWLKELQKSLLDNLSPKIEFWERPFTFQQLIDRYFGLVKLDLAIKHMTQV